jgi:ribosome maturation factor RimP
MTDSLESLVKARVSALGFDLEALELTPAGKKRVLRVAIDCDGGVGIDQITDVSRDLSELLDESDVMGQLPYTLEVTSRGINRPLELPRHWRRNEGRLVRIRLADDDSSIDGRIGASDDEGVEIVGRTTTRYSYDQITSALVQIELNRKDV